MVTALMVPLLDLPADPALPGLYAATPKRMLDALRESLVCVSATERETWKVCTVLEAVYQPGRACRVAYGLGESEDAEQRELVYARWDAQSRPHRSAIRVQVPDGWFDVYRYPRDRRMRQIRSMRRDSWLREASKNWVRQWLGGGEFAQDDWRCTPIKYVPESRLVCRLKGRWIGLNEDHWVRAYVRISRRNDATAQFETLRAIEQSLAQCLSGVSVPHPLGCLARQHLMATEFIRGQTLRAAAGAEGPDLLADACRKLATMSRARPHQLTTTTHSSDLITPIAMLGDLAAGSGAAAALCKSLQRWAETNPCAPGAIGLVHGDLHGGQVILKGDRLCAVDWDLASVGDGTRDITNLASEFAAASWMNRGASAAIDLAVTSVEAWRQAGGHWNEAAARWWTTRALVHRAWGLMRHLRSGWPKAVNLLLARALQTQERGCEFVR